MGKIYYSARGDKVDYDAELIKQQLANAPLTIEVESKRNLIDNRSDRKPRKAIEEAPKFIEETETLITNEIEKE